jgi:hypothetical protein
MKPVVFAAFEAGPAAWMAPVAAALGVATALRLAPVAARHLERQGALPDAWTRLDPEAPLGEAAAVVLSATGHAAESRLVAEARERRIASIQVVDTWGPYKRRFAGDVWADMVAVVDAAAAAEATAEGVPTDHCAIVGQPAWEAAAPLPPGCADIVAFAGQPVRAKYGSALGFDEASAFALLTAALAAEPTRYRPPIYILHPEEDAPPPGAGRATRDAASALAEAGALAGMFSSLMVDAAIGGRRVVSVQPGLAVADPCPLSRHGRVPRAGDALALLAALDRAPPDGHALRESFAGSRARAVSLIRSVARP